MMSNLNKNLLLLCIWFLPTFCEISGSKLDSEHNSTGMRLNYSISISTETLHEFFIPLMFNDVSPNENYRLHTEYCERKSQCGSNTTPRNCQCDNLCGQFNDCCSDINQAKIFYESAIDQHQIECVQFNSHSGLKSTLMVSKCPDLWTENKTKQLCEGKPSTWDILLTIPVSSYGYNIIFTNMYCAYCNNVSEFTFWTLENVCLDQSINETCLVLNYKSNDTTQFRECLDTNITSTCSIFYNSTANANTLTKLCESEPVLLVYDQNEVMYKNKYCALCNELDENSLFCGPPFESDRKIIIVQPTYSYRLLVDFNSHQYQTIHEGDTYEGSFKDCSSVHDELYDPVSKTCKTLYCPSTFTAIKGRCFPNKNLRTKTQESERQCTFVKLEPNEYKIHNITSIFVLSLNRSVGHFNFLRNGSDIYVCEHVFKKYELIPVSIYFDATENYVSFCGIICSIVSLIITLSVYMLLPELRNTPGKNLICLMSALVLAQILFLSSNAAVHSENACMILAILVHYFFLASFTWMNVIAFDLYSTFSHSFQANSSRNQMSKQFCRYSLYGWLLPVAIVTAAITFDNISIRYDHFKPRYGENACWISSKKSLVLFFIGPLAVFKLFDIIAFICTSFHISKSRRQGSMARTYSLCSFLLYLKLSLIMGFAWLFAFVAAFSNDNVMWYVFIIFNTLQGVFIAFSFLCTSRVINLVRGKVLRRQNVDSSSGILLTPLNKL